MKNYILLFLVSLCLTAYAPDTYQKISNSDKTINKITTAIEIDNKKDSCDIKLLSKMKMIKYFNKSDREHVRVICDSLNIETKHLYTIIKLESSGNKKAFNKNSKAVGLIGFLPKTAKRLGTSTEEILQMSNKQQLDLVYAYFLLINKNKKISHITDLYIAVLYPKALNKSDEYVIGEKNSKAVKWNRPLDIDKDSILTVKDVKSYITDFII